MKRLLLFLFSAIILGACAKETNVELVKFTDTGCSKQSMVPQTKSGDGSDSQLILRYSAEVGGLEVTRTNAMMNCSINNGGLSCDFSVDGNVITYHTYETDGPIMKCLCPVSNISLILSGLRVGREYVLNYSCGDVTCSPISFTFSKQLNLVLDIDLYKI